MPIQGMRLEEFNYDDGEGVWLITLSFVEPSQIPTLQPAVRSYKTFAVHGESGQVISMKIRNPLTPASQR
jgi:hypothetical protein